MIILLWELKLEINKGSFILLLQFHSIFTINNTYDVCIEIGTWINFTISLCWLLYEYIYKLPNSFRTCESLKDFKTMIFTWTIDM